jgi:radical SAM protein with 4Fe4S-binding SPASM domain
LEIVRHLRSFASGNAVAQADMARGLPSYSLFADRPVTCSVAYEFTLIDAFGRVFPCCYAYQDNQAYSLFEERRNQFCLGNINENKLKDIWASSGYSEFRESVTPVHVENMPNVCGQCLLYYDFKEWVQSITRKDH